MFTLYDYSQGSRGASLASIVITSTGGASAQAAAPSGPGSGNITASPNPCVIPPGANVCSVYLSWSSTGVTRVYVENLGKGHEREYSANSRCEHCEANWIQADSKYLFTLYDFSSGAKSKALGSVTVTATR